MGTNQPLVAVSDFSAPDDCPENGHCNDMFMEFLYIVAIPGGVTLILTCILCIVMCCCGTQRKKRCDSEEEIQMDRYLSLRRASQSLRELSRKRDQPLLDMSGSLQTLEHDRFRHDRCQSAPGTLQRDRRRHHRDVTPQSLPPPSYHLPPDYNSLSNRNGAIHRPDVHMAAGFQDDSSDHDNLLPSGSQQSSFQ